MKTAILPGSFDPVTNGHLDIIKRASLIFDEVMVLVMKNLNKKSLFSVKERIEMLEISVSGLKNVTVSFCDDLISDYVRNKNVVVIKGVRSSSDFNYEYQMALINKKLNVDCETMFLPAKSEYSVVSSSAVKQILNFGGDASWMLPQCVKNEVYKKFNM